ncbi:MAG: YhdH/YhfP family quinone oxidoreductase [Desulfobacterales bacterium]
MSPSDSFSAMIVKEDEVGRFQRAIETKQLDELPDGEVLIKVAFSSLNYKDALSATGNRGVTRKFPHTPGIDAAGVVAESSHEAFTSGEAVLVTGYDLGMNTAGGFAQYIRVPAQWVVKLPATLSLKESMTLGTAGFTAGLCVEQLLSHGITPEKGPILVSGATGGVGSLALAILAHLGFSVSAVSGKAEKEAFLRQLGAGEILSREAAQDSSGRPMLKARWAGVVDTVGGEILATAIKSTQLNGVVTCCGLVASPDLPINVFPFILRGVMLIGIDSQECERTRRLAVWEKLAGTWRPPHLAAMTTEVLLENLDGYIERILKGGVTGRIVVKIPE